MSVYVDDVRHPFRRMIMCHMWSDNLDELHAMAASIGMQRKWFQCSPNASWEHYDISLTMKAAAIKRGAILTDKFGPLEFLAWRSLDLEQLKRIAEWRARDRSRISKSTD